MPLLLLRTVPCVYSPRHSVGRCTGTCLCRTPIPAALRCPPCCLRAQTLGFLPSSMTQPKSSPTSKSQRFKQVTNCCSKRHFFSPFQRLEKTQISILLFQKVLPTLTGTGMRVLLCWCHQQKVLLTRTLGPTLHLPLTKANAPSKQVSASPSQLMSYPHVTNRINKIHLVLCCSFLDKGGKPLVRQNKKNPTELGFFSAKSKSFERL